MRGPSASLFQRALEAGHMGRNVNVLFKVLGGPVVGMGHVVRSLELAGALQERGFGVAGFLCNADVASRARIAEGGFRCICSAQDEGAPYRATIERLIEEQPDLVVLDHDGDFSEFSKIVKRTIPGVFLVALDNFAMRDENLDVVVNLLNHNPALKSPTSARVRYYEGVEYAILRSGFAEYAAARRRIRSRVGDVLVTFGGWDPRRHTLFVLEALRACDTLSIVFHIVVGASFRHAREVAAEAKKIGPRVEILRDVTEMADLMFRCDIGFTGGGTTMMEMAAAGTPSIVLPQTEREFKFAGLFEANGAVIRAGGPESLTVGAVVGAFEELCRDRKTRQSMSRAGRRMVDGHGRDRVADLIAADFLSHRDNND